MNDELKEEDIIRAVKNIYDIVDRRFTPEKRVYIYKAINSETKTRGQKSNLYKEYYTGSK